MGTRIFFLITGVILALLACGGTYGFAYFDGRPEVSGGVVGVAGVCLMAAFVAACLAYGCFSVAFTRRRG